jgi:hypothetical protein
MIATNECVAIWLYYHDGWSIALQCFCNISDTVAIDGMVMQQTSLRDNIWKLQWFCVGGNREHMKQTIVGDNRWYGNATHKVHCNNTYCNQNQLLFIILSQRG